MATWISTDFTFDNVSSTVHGIQIVKIDNGGLIETPIAGGRNINQDFSMRDKPWFHSANVLPQEVNLTFTISATPNAFDTTKRTAVFDWLFSPRVYCDLISADNLNKVYKIIFTSPLQFTTTDLTNGFFSLSAMMYPFAYTTLQTYTNAATPTSITINNPQNVRNIDNTYYYYPIVYADLTSTATSFKITNTSDSNRIFEITGCELLEELFVDNDLKIINSNQLNVDRFATLTSKRWLRLVKGSNVLTINTTADVTITCQYPIMV